MSFEYHAPRSVADAVALATRFGDDARFLAGGTDLLIQMRRGKVAPAHLVSLRDVPGLDRVEMNGRVRLGALVTHRRLERTPAFQGRLRALVEGARVVGGHQVRNVATVGGNVVNASPAADVVPALLVLDAIVACAGPDGERRLPLGAFLAGPGRTLRRPEELLTAIEFAVPPPGSSTAFLKAGRRRAMEISVVCVAARLALDEAGRCRDARVALGAVGPTTLRARRAEGLLEGQAPTAETLRRAGETATEECAPISDVRASAAYRRLLVATLVPRALARCVERIREETS